MAGTVSKLAVAELGALLTPKTQAITPAFGREDLMERAADLLSDPWARIFFTTVAGFTRLHQIMTGASAETVVAAALPWLGRHFPQLQARPELQPLLETIARQALAAVNLNITFKRLTSILTQAERAVLAEGLLDLLSPQANLKPEQIQIVEETLIKLMLSQQAGMELLDHWKRKRRLASEPGQLL